MGGQGKGGVSQEANGPALSTCLCHLGQSLLLLQALTQVGSPALAVLCLHGPLCKFMMLKLETGSKSTA